MIVLKEKDHNIILQTFDANPNEDIIIEFPGSGSYYQSFENKDAYLKMYTTKQEYFKYMRKTYPNGNAWAWEHDANGSRITTADEKLKLLYENWNNANGKYINMYPCYRSIYNINYQSSSNFNFITESKFI